MQLDLSVIEEDAHLLSPMQSSQIVYGTLIIDEPNSGGTNA